MLSACSGEPEDPIVELAKPGPVFLLGFDGLQPGLVSRYLEEGLLPNFARLRDEGATGAVRSTIPMISPPAWTSVATGTNPGDHGVWGFWIPDGGNPRGRYVDATCRLAPAIWEDLTEAQQYFREALEGGRRVLGDDHPDTLIWISNMGTLLMSMGKYTDAEPYNREALEGRRRVLGDDHPNTLSSINNMGYMLESMGKHVEAEPYCREALEGCRHVLGDDHPRTLTSINNMGTLLMSIGKYVEALPYYREALRGNRRVLGDDHPKTLISIHNMGRLMRELGRLEEAEALGAEAVRGANAKLAQSHPFRFGAIGGYGHTLARLHRYGDAEGHLLQAHEGLVWILGPADEHTVRVVNYLITLYDAWHAAEPGEGYDVKAAEWREKLPKSKEPEATEP